MNPVRRRVADYAANLRTWSTERPQSVPCCSEVDEICCNHRVISLSAALCLTHCFKFRTDLGQFRRDRRNQWIRQESRKGQAFSSCVLRAGTDQPMPDDLL